MTDRLAKPFLSGRWQTQLINAIEKALPKYIIMKNSLILNHL